MRKLEIQMYCALSTSQFANYGKFKERIIQAYGLVPKTYSQKFRNLVKQGGQMQIKGVVWV